MQIEKLHRKTLFEHKIGSRVLGSISFNQPSPKEKDKTVKLLIIYSRAQILVYKVSTIKKPDSNHLKPHFLMKKTIYGSIKSIVKLTNSRRKKPIFSILFRSGRISTFNVDLEHNFLQVLAMHELNTKEVLSMERNAPNTAKLHFSIKSDINSNGICVLRSRCIFSFHLVANYAKQFGLEGKVFHNGAIMLVQDLVQKTETFGNSLHIDLRIFTLDNISDFNFICHPTHISLYMIAAIPSYHDKKVKSIDNKLIEVKITPVLLQKMKNIKSNHDIVHNIKIKDHITSFNFLPKDVYKFFLMKNYGIVVATSKGIFYINGWILLLTFDRNSANEYLSKLPNIQVQYTKISLENVFEGLKNANYKFEEDQLSIEFPNQFVTLDFEFSPFDPKKCNQIHVSKLQKVKRFDLRIFEKSKSYLIGKESHTLKMFRVTTARIRKEESHRDHKKDLQRFSIVEPFGSKIVEKDTMKILNCFDSFNDMCTIRKNGRFDFTMTSINGGYPYLINGMKGVKATVRKTLNLGSRKAFLISKRQEGESSSLNFFVECAKKAVKIVSVEPDSDSMFMNLLENVAFEQEQETIRSFDYDDVMMMQVTRRALLVVNKRYLNLSSFRHEFGFEVKNCCKMDDKIFMLGVDGDVRVIRVGKKDEGDEFSVEDLTADFDLGDLNLDFVTSFNLLMVRKDHDRYLVVSTADNFVKFYHMQMDKKTKEIRGFEVKAQFICTQAAYLMKNTVEMDKEQLDLIRKNSSRKSKSELVNFDRSISEPCWNLDLVLKRSPSGVIQELFTSNLGETLILILKFSTGDIVVYRSLDRLSNPDRLKEQTFIREQIPFACSSKLGNLKNLKPGDMKGESEQAADGFLMAISKIKIQDKNKIILVSGMGVRPFVITQKYGLLYFHPINVPKNSAITHLTGSKFLSTNPEALSLNLLDIYFPSMLNHHFPCDVYEISGKPMRVFNINKNNKSCLLLWVVKKFQDHLELYSLDGAFKKIDYVAFNSEDKITAIKSVFIAYQMKEYDETLAVMYITKQAQGFYSKWMLLRLNCDSDPKGKENTRLRVGEVNIDQEGNELITCTFSVDGNLFVCIGNRILQMSFTTGAKMARTYYPNMSYVVDAAVSNNSVALCNIRGRVILLVWIEEQKKLIQRACYNIENCLLREISFLDNEQAKLVCTDSSGKLYLLSVFSGKSEGEINLKTINVINLGSNSVNIVSREDSKGIDIALIDGSIMSLRSCKIQGEKLLRLFMNLYDFVSRQIPHSLGLKPQNQANLLVIDRISFEHLSKKELINAHALNSFLGLSFPLQKSGLQSIGAHRIEINDVFNCQKRLTPLKLAINNQYNFKCQKNLKKKFNKFVCKFSKPKKKKKNVPRKSERESNLQRYAFTTKFS